MQSRPANAQQQTTVQVILDQPWTDTGLQLAQGQSVTITATGTMNWFTGACNGYCLSTPAGIPCPGHIVKRLGLTCLSLIGRVGPFGGPFEVGDSITFTAPQAGELYLGVNDDNLADNTGAWTAQISLAGGSTQGLAAQGPVASPRSTPPAPAYVGPGLVVEPTKETTPHDRDPLVPSMSQPTPAMRARPSDLNGIWQGFPDSPAFVKTIRITQTGSSIVAETLTAGFAPTGRLYFRGTYDPPSIPGRIELAEYGLIPALGAKWTPEVLTVGDPDHLQVGNRPPFVRATFPPTDDIPCDAENSFHVQSRHAVERGKVAHNAGNYDGERCWYYVGARLDNAEAQGRLGGLFRAGFHVQKNPAIALYWLQRSAALGLPAAAMTLAAMYDNGEGTPVDHAKADAWRARGSQLDAQVRRQARAEQRAEAQANAAMDALTRLAIVGTVLLTDPGPPAPCRIAASHPHNLADQSAIEQAKREIAAQGIQCPPDW